MVLAVGCNSTDHTLSAGDVVPRAYPSRAASVAWSTWQIYLHHMPMRPPANKAMAIGVLFCVLQVKAHGQRDLITVLGLPVDLLHDFRPAIYDRQHRIRLLRREHRDHARDAHLSEVLHPVKILAETEQADFDGSWIAPGLPYHLVEFRHGLGNIAMPGCWNPTVAIADRAPRAVREGAADMDGRVRFPHWFGPGDHRIEMDELPMVFGVRFRPDLLHRLNRFAHPLEAARVDGAVVLHFVLVPASADAKQEASLAHLVDRGDQLGGLDRVALLHQQHAGAEFDGPGDLAGRGQHYEGVHCVVVLFGQVAPSREWRLARQGDMRVLGCPNRLETALLERVGKLHRRHRIIGEEHRATEMHANLRCFFLVRRVRLTGGVGRRHRSDDTRCREPHPGLPNDRERGLKWGPKSVRKDPRSRRPGRAKSSMSTWTRSTHRSNSATIPSCAASRSRSAGPANAASSRPRATKHASLACIPRCRRSRPSEDARIWYSLSRGSTPTRRSLFRSGTSLPNTRPSSSRCRST